MPIKSFKSINASCLHSEALLRSRKPPGFSSADNGALHVALVNILELEGAEHVTWIHLDSLGFTWIHLDSLGFTWIHLDSLVT